jgi:hypothetical protein
MSKMPLDDDRASRCERRCRVSACHRERQWKVARPEYGDWAETDLAEPYVGARKRLPVWYRLIDAEIEPLARANDASEQSKLVDRSREFSLKPEPRQARFLDSAVEQFRPDRFDIVGDPLEESRPRIEAGGAIDIERFVREATGTIDIGCGRKREGWGELLTSRRVGCAEFLLG